MLDSLADVHRFVLEELLGAEPAGGPGPAEEALAEQRSCAAYALASVHTAKASLLAAPALVAAVQVQQRPGGAHTPDEKGAFAAALAAASATLRDASHQVNRISRNLTGPEPRDLSDLNARTAGARAAATARARSRSAPGWAGSSTPVAAGVLGQSR
ncbi:hypothetical protein ACFVH7_12365 [Kitasatospora indigofera]|uniref:hypothetical protein n=1 Tax=Kitasatospora indigofera TaxID=67307 RepID=UPI0036399CF9